MIIRLPEVEIVKEDGLARVERAGRCCYQSEPREGDTTEAFVRRLVAKKHWSVLEHWWLAATGHRSSLAGISPYVKYDSETGVAYANARAWRESGVALPVDWLAAAPALWEDLPRERFISSLRPAPLPERVHCVRFVVDRGVSHELVRHRPVSYSQESTRYCDYGGVVTFIRPPWVDVNPGEYAPPFAFSGATGEWLLAMACAEQQYRLLLDLGWSSQQARSVLPNSTKTEMYVTAPASQWDLMFSLRCSPQAHPQMREVMEPLRRSL